MRCLLRIHNGFFFFFLIIRSVVSDLTMVAQDRLRNIYFYTTNIHTTLELIEVESQSNNKI